MSITISTGIESLDSACELACRTLRMNVSEKWGKLCPVLAPAWGPTYPAWIHVCDNYWMGHITPFLYPKDQVEWPVILNSFYQWPNGMIRSGIHDCDSPKDTRLQFDNMTSEEVHSATIASRYPCEHLFILQVNDLWQNYGDIEIIRSLYPSCKKAIDFMYSVKDSDGDGLVEASDSVEDIDAVRDGLRSSPNAAERFHDQVLLYGSLLAYAEMSDLMEDQKAAAQARTRADKLAKTVNDLFWDERGFYTYSIDTKNHRPIHPGVTSAYGCGYGILWGLVPPERAEQVLTYLASWEFEVPGPIILPPITDPEIKMMARNVHAPGIYLNGGCGWGRGYLPSVCIAFFRSGRLDLGMSYLLRMAKAANEAGAYYEFWSWEKYAGGTVPGGCKDYSETAAAFLESVIKGLFGMEQLEPGWKKFRFAPANVGLSKSSISLDLPGGKFSANLENNADGWIAQFESQVERKIEVLMPEGNIQDVLINGKVEIKGS